MENIKKNNIKRILIVFLVTLAVSELLWGMTISLSASANADADLKMAIQFVQSEEYYGMTIEECEMILGEPIEGWKEGYAYFNAGTYEYQKGGDYILTVFLDDEQRVRQVLLEEVW